MKFTEDSLEQAVIALFQDENYQHVNGMFIHKEMKYEHQRNTYFQNNEGNIKVDVRLEEETVWLTQEQMALLFGKVRSTITEHIGNVFKEGELTEELVCRDFRHTTIHGAIQGKTQEKLFRYWAIFQNKTYLKH